VTATSSASHHRFPMARLLFPELAALEHFELAVHRSVTPLRWSLAPGACLGRNGTLVGASANVVAVRIAERRGECIGFTRVGLPLALVSLVVSSCYDCLRNLADG
jgi:Na+/H+ antiporter NhaD/arsenite permease-like protein